MNLWTKGKEVFYRNSPSLANEYHGLVNQGATCYLNSVLQVLFMSKDFRAAVERHTSENPYTGCIDRQLTSLFDDLKRYDAYTYHITKKLGIDKVYEQRDAAEYFEKILSLTSPEASKIFHMLMTHKVICSGCCAETDTEGPSWYLPLALVDSHSEHYRVVDGIEEYFRASDLSGGNQVYCDRCDAKSDATIKCVMRRHPDVLMLLLKRFEFDYRYMTYVKISCTVEVPYTLQIPENQTYELYAVVDHFGDLRGGHYTAAIKSQDDEKWYDFNDTSVTLLRYQPFQVDSFEKSDSAYLLFYRKKDVRAADNCSQDIMDVSPPGGILSATSEIHEAGKIQEREEVEGVADIGNVTSAAVSMDRNEEMGITDVVSVESRGLGLTSDLCSNVEGHYLHYSPQDAHTEKQIDERKIMTSGEENMRGNAEADNNVQKRGNSSREEAVEGQDIDDDVGQMRPDFSQDVEPEVSDRRAIDAYLTKQGEISDTQRREMDVKTERKYADRNAEYQDNDSGRLDDVRETKPQNSLEGGVAHNEFNDQKYNRHARHDDAQVCVDMQRGEERMATDRNRDKDAEYALLTEYQKNDRFDDARQSINKDRGVTQEVGQDYGLKYVSTDKQGDRERMERDVKADEEGKTGAGERGSVSGREKLLHYQSQDYGRIGDSEQKMAKADQKCKQGSSSRYERNKQEVEERRDAQGDKEQKRGDDLSEGVEDQDRRRSDDVRQKRPQEQRVSVTHPTHEDVGVERQDKEQRKKDDSMRQIKNVSRGNSQPKGSVTEFNEDAMKESKGSKKSRIQVRIIETECKETPLGPQRSSETKNLLIETNSHQETLSKPFRRLKVSDSSSPEPQKHGTKRVFESAQEDEGAKKKRVSEGQEQAAEGKQAKEKGGECERRRGQGYVFSSRKKEKKEKRKKEKKKRRKTTGCFSWFKKSRKNAEQTSESD
ncbi:uncharacterized protein [Pempheris klunzingeri]|uniref:uncharacterized protein n=1 Tax=Pempheris klunzingeri TaxID=3127111 RepID=UPI0039817C68